MRIAFLSMPKKNALGKIRGKHFDDISRERTFIEVSALKKNYNEVQIFTKKLIYNSRKSHS